MDFVHMPQSALVIQVIKLMNEDWIRDLLLWQKEMLIKEFVDPRDYKVPDKFIKMSQDERIGMIRGLRWVLDDDDANLL